MTIKITTKQIFRTTGVFFLIIFLLLLSISSCASTELKKQRLIITRIDGTTIGIEAEIARTNTERNAGYMGRERIPNGTGMLFVFDRDQILSFWMKDTPTPLSIAYIDSRGRIREIYDMTPFSRASVTSTLSARYALEVPQGWFFENGITAGSTIQLPD